MILHAIAIVGLILKCECTPGTFYRASFPTVNWEVFSQFSRWQKWNSERWSSLLKITQLMSEWWVVISSFLRPVRTWGAVLAGESQGGREHLRLLGSRGSICSFSEMCAHCLEFFLVHFGLLRTHYSNSVGDSSSWKNDDLQRAL